MNFMKQFIEDVKMDVGYRVCCEGSKVNSKILFVISFVQIIYIFIEHGFLSLICKYKDHDWVDESYGGPDSGCMAGTCRRCGKSFHHILY